MSEVLNKSEKQTNMVDSSAAEIEQLNNNSAIAGDAGNSASETTTTSPTLSSPKMENKKSPVKRTPSKRMSFIERAQKESEELVKTMGGSLELEGGRRTRSSTRGTPTRAAVVVTPPPAKKARTSPASSNSASSRARGRGRKLNAAVEASEMENKEEEKPKTDSDVEAANDKVNTDESKSKKGADAVDSVGNPAPTVNETDNKDGKKHGENQIGEKAEITAESVTEPLPEKSQKHNVGNGLDANAQKVDAPNQGSPMETDEPIESVASSENVEPERSMVSTKEVSAPEKTEVPISIPSTSAPAEKQPTPEPMDVDSSSKSNDAVDNVVVGSAASAKKINSESVGIGEAQSKAELASQKSDASPIVETNEKQADGVAVMTNNNVADTNILENATLAATDGIVNSSEKQTSNAVETKCSTNNDALSIENKTENDLCAPKIAADPINTSADNAVTTPQSCN